jgi:sugar phosphate permease
MSSAPAQASEQFQAATYRKVTLRLMPFLFICYVLAYINRVNVNFAKLQMQQDLGWSDEIYGIGAGIFFVGYFFFNVPSNMVLKKIGARNLLGPMLILRAILSAMMIYVHSSTSYYVLRFVGGVVEAGFFPGVVLYFTFWFTTKYRGQMMALFMSAIPISQILASPVSGWIMKDLNGAAGLNGWQWLFVTCAAPLLLAGVGVFFMMTNDPERAHWLTTEERKVIIGNIHAEEEAKKRSGPVSSSMADAFKSPAVWLLCLIYFGNSSANYGIGFYMPQVIKDTISSDLVVVGWVTAIPWIVTSIFMFMVGRHSDRTGERRLHIAIPYLVGALTLAACGIPGISATVSLVSLTVATACVLSSFSLVWTLPSSILAGTAAAAGIAWINAVGNLGGYVAPHVAGVIVDRTHSTSLAMVALGVGMLVSGVTTLYVTRKGFKA